MTNKHTRSVSLIDGHTEEITDAEVIKALECCKSFDDLRACYKCPALENGDCSNGKVYISNFILDKALDLINRQQAEIERLNEVVNGTENSFNKMTELYHKAFAETKGTGIERRCGVMKHCEKCLYYEKCKAEIDEAPDDIFTFFPYNEDCPHFKNKADFVEVVRCKDCKQFMEYAEGVQCVEKSNGDCFIRMMCCIDRQFEGVTYDDFCSYGERKDA